ncbi:MAG: flavin-dependent oxidoreductase [Pseudomonadota bacterium]
MDVMVVGGGIGGLTLALALESRGLRAQIFEQSPSLRALGVGINTLPHAIRALAALGLLESLDRIGLRTKELIYKTARGQEILRQPRGLAAGHRAPQFSIHRGRLLAVLHQAVIERLGDGQVHLDHRFVGVLETNRGVEARFARADGSTVSAEADILVGADGIHSAVRSQRHPDEGPPRWNGVVMWRGATWWPPFLSGQSMIIAGGMAAKLVLYPIATDPERPGEVLMNWVVCAKTGEAGAPLPHRDDWSSLGRAEDVMAHVDGVFTLDEVDLPALIGATEEIFLYPMCDREPLLAWSIGRTTLLGDAAHPMYPVGSNGASQAILDAVALADALAEEADPLAALAAYDHARRPPTAEIVRANREGGPERVIDLVEARAPNGFTSLSDVTTHDELIAIVGEYQRIAGFTPDLPDV